MHHEKEKVTSITGPGTFTFTDSTPYVKTAPNDLISCCLEDNPQMTHNTPPQYNTSLRTHN